MLFTDAACEVFMDIFSPSIWAVHCRCNSFRPQGYFIFSNWIDVHAQDLVFVDKCNRNASMQMCVRKILHNDSILVWLNLRSPTFL